MSLYGHHEALAAMASSRSTPIQHNALKPTSRLRLLMPTVRPPHIHDPSSVLPLPQTATTTPRSPRLRPTPTNRLIRSRSGSASDPVPVAAAVPPTPMPADTGSEWLGVPYKFEIVQEELQIDGYQMYAVEKWYFPAIYMNSRSFIYWGTGS